MKALTKRRKRKHQVAFIQFIGSDGVVGEQKISMDQYSKMGQAVIDRFDSTKMYIGGYTRFDYDTPTGLLSDGEYGDDGEGMVQIKMEDSYVVVPKELVVNDQIDEKHPRVVSRLKREREALK